MNGLRGSAHSQIQKQVQGGPIGPDTLGIFWPVPEFLPLSPLTLFLPRSTWRKKYHSYLIFTMDKLTMWIQYQQFLLNFFRFTMSLLSLRAFIISFCSCFSLSWSTLETTNLCSSHLRSRRWTLLVKLGWRVGIPKVKLERHKYFSSFALNSKFGISALPDFPTRLFISTSPAIIAGHNIIETCSCSFCCQLNLHPP